MTKIRKSIVALLACLTMLLVGAAVFVACGSSDSEYTVTFSIEGKEQTATTENGKVKAEEFPSDPTKEYYEFRGWYSTADYAEGTEFTSDTKVTKNMTVYAYFVAIRIDISVNGGAATEIKLEELAEKTDYYTADAAGNNLTFDGWYLDGGFTTSYSKQDTDSLYARYVATVTFDNGYETVYSTSVEVDHAVSQPSSGDIVKYYMDDEDISYVDEDGNDFDFSQNITANTTVTVLWKTPYAVYKQISGSNYEFTGFDGDHTKTVQTYPVISVLSKNVSVDENGTKGTVVAVTNGSFDIEYCSTSAKKIILNDGICYVKGLTSQITSTIEEVRLPSTLKILESSFWNYTELKSLTLPEGLEVIIDCFWADYKAVMVGQVRDNGYDFDIHIPSSVTNIVMVPSNVVFAEDSPFYVEGNRIYKGDGSSDGKILVGDYQSNVANGLLEIPDGVTGIQVGVFYGMTFDYLYLPESFREVSYNNPYEDYKTFYTGSFLTESDYVNNPTAAVNMGVRGFAVFSSLSDVQYVVFDTDEYPLTVNGDYAFTDQLVSWKNMENSNLVFMKEVEDGQEITVSVAYSNAMSGEESTVSFAFTAGGTLTEDALLEQIGLTEETLGYAVAVTSITQFGQEYAFGKVNTNLYLVVAYGYAATGYTAELNDDGTYTVTGFDAETAQQLDDGSYLVVINRYNGAAVTAIADGAFKNNNKISKVYIANTVKSIGAEAFMNTSNLQYLCVYAGGLETVGASAFENIGCYYNASSENDNKYDQNQSIPSTGVVISIPLANLKSVGAYAFKSRAIQQFTPVEGEKDRNLMDMVYTSQGLKDGDFTLDDLVEGQFYYGVDGYSGVTNIVQYVSTSVEKKQKAADDETEIDVNVHDVKLVATAGGYTNKSGSFTLGWSYRVYAKYFGDTVNSNVFRYEVMEGSVYFLDNAYNNIAFGLVSMIHANAFTDMGERDMVIYAPAFDTWLDADAVRSQDSSVFEEGWWEGNANTDNAFMQELTTSTASLGSN